MRCFNLFCLFGLSSCNPLIFKMDLNKVGMGGGGGWNTQLCGPTEMLDLFCCIVALSVH